MNRKSLPRTSVRRAPGAAQSMLVMTLRADPGYSLSRHQCYRSGTGMVKWSRDTDFAS
ncbi:putative membrane-anchored protein [Microbacterium natoriense]|uniref:Membrane-anchored protein n=1 Tax=Microbacterium natoriense TaxID=284570 RepID=A0AAW8EX36_9MICO|nr:putative membrane-anchored protein [Microbacterium natoriense]